MNSFKRGHFWMVCSIIFSAGVLAAGWMLLSGRVAPEAAPFVARYMVAMLALQAGCFVIQLKCKEW